MIELAPAEVERDCASPLRDRGPGIPEGEHNSIFEPFYRGPGAQPDVGGVGLGLSIARGVAEAQGGSLELTPRDGGGSLFTLFVPAMSVEELSELELE